MNWFAAHGDKLLAGISGTAISLAQVGVIPTAYVGVASGIAAMLHTLFWPSPPAETPR